MKRQKITLQYKCRRCGERYFDPNVDFIQNVEQIRLTSSLMTTIHDCNDNYDKTRFGIADLIGCKVEKE
jgi:hypothetical protein